MEKLTARLLAWREDRCPDRRSLAHQRTGCTRAVFAEPASRNARAKNALALGDGRPVSDGPCLALMPSYRTVPEKLHHICWLLLMRPSSCPFCQAESAVKVDETDGTHYLHNCINFASRRSGSGPLSGQAAPVRERAADGNYPAWKRSRAHPKCAGGRPSSTG